MQLTIDGRIQAKTEEALADVGEKYDAEGGDRDRR